MESRSLLGTAAFALVDALGAGVFAGVLTFLFAPVGLFDSQVAVATTVAAAVTGVVLAAALAVAVRGGRPFPATRLVLRGFERLPDWM